MPNTPPPVRAGASRLLRHLLPWGLALAAATCTGDQTGPTIGGQGYFSFRPAYHLAGGASLSQFGIVADSVHIHLTRPVNITVLDTAVFFPSDSGTLHLALPITLTQSPETLSAVITITAGSAILFQDSVSAVVKDGPPGSSTPPTVNFSYVGPGASMKTLAIVPADTTIVLGDTLFFSATATDSADAPIASFYVGWRSSDTTLARINAAGRLIAPNQRGTVSIIGLSPTGISDTTVVTFAPVPVIILADSGDGQSGIAGDSLAALFVAQVKGADSLGIAGIPVRFTAVTAGGAVRDTLVLTDLQGRARTRAKLDTVAQTYTFTATALGTGLPARSFSATATAGAAATIAIAGGNGQVDTIGKTLGVPLSVRVRDAFGNGVGGATVVFTRIFGTGVVGSDSVTTAVDGDASTSYTLGSVAGVDSIQALLAGTSATVVFTSTATAGAATAIAVDSGNAQSAVVLTAFADSLVVRVTDGGANPVAGATVDWNVAAGDVTLSAATSLTGSDGRARIALSAGSNAGPAAIDAVVSGLSDTAAFDLTVLAGPAASLTIAGGNDQTAGAGAPVALPLTVLVTDSLGNFVPGATVDFSVTAGGGTVDSTTATSNTVGIASSGTWTLGTTGGNQVRVTSAAVPADTLFFDAVSVPAGVTKLWTAAVNNAWNLAGNWSPSGIPVATDNVFVPAAPPSPVVPATTAIHDLVLEPGSTVTLAAITLSVGGDALLDGALTGTGTLNLNGAGTTLRGDVSTALVTVNGTPALGGPTTITGPLTINSGFVHVNGKSLAVTGNVVVQGSGQLVMSTFGDSVDIGGNLSYTTTTTGNGSASEGVLVVRGNFSQTGGIATSFAGSGSHRTRFLGAGTQTVSFANPGSANSRFQDVEFGSAAGTTLNSTFTAMGTTSVTGGTVTGIGRTANLGGDLFATYANWQVSTTLWGASPTNYPDSLSRNVTVFNGWTLSKPFKADSNLLINSTGLLTLNGRKLRVGGSLTQGGRLVMAAAADTLDIGGAFTVNSATAGSGDLTAGLLTVRGNFTQSGASTSFAPSGSFVTGLLGSGGHTVNFASAGAANSHFQTLVVADSLSVGSSVAVTGDLTLTPTGRMVGGNTGFLSGNLVDSSLAGWRMATTELDRSFLTIPATLTTNLVLADSQGLVQHTSVVGNVTIAPTGYFAPTTYTLTVSGNFTQNGLLSMTATGDSLDVGGSFTVGSAQSAGGKLSNGGIVIRGGFTQTAGAVDNFAATGTHHVYFEGPAARTVSLAAPAQSPFAALEIDSTGAITLQSDLYTSGTLRVRGTPATTLVGATPFLVHTGGLDVDGLIADKVLLQMRSAVNGMTFNNVTFTNQDPTRDQLTVEVPGLAGDTLRLDNVTFGGTPTTGHFVVLSDSVSDGAPATVAFYNSTPLNGALYTATSTVADPVNVLWSHLEWLTEPGPGIELQPFVPAPQVRAVDPSGTVLTGFSGPVTVAFFTDPTGGSAVLANNTIAAVGGVATFDSLTVSLSAPGYQFQASAPGLGTTPASAAIVLLVPLPPGTTTAFNNGGGDGSWTNPANWTSGVPDSLGNAFVYPNQTVTVDAPSRVNRLTVGTGATVLLNADLAADSSIDAGQTIAGAGILLAQGTGTISGQLGTLEVTGNYVVTPAETLFANTVTISGSGSLDAGTSMLQVNGNLNTTGAGTLAIATPGALVEVFGNADFGGGNSNLSDGTLQVGGDLSRAGAGTAHMTGGLTLQMNGSGHQQNINYPGTDSTDGLGNLGFYGDTLRIVQSTWVLGGVDLARGITQIDSTLFATQPFGGAAIATVQGNTLWLGNVMLFSGAYAVGTTVFGGNGLTIPALSAPYDTLLVQGFDSLQANVSANMVSVSNGVLVLGGHRLDVSGDFSTGPFGKFTMTDPADTVFVGGNFTAGGSATNGMLTAGLLQIAGNFTETMGTQTGDFQAEPGHTTRLSGSGPHTISFAAPLDAQNPDLVFTSYFGDLELAGGIDSIITTVPAKGNILVNGSPVVSDPELGGTLATLGNVTIAFSPQFAVRDLMLAGGLQLQSGTFAVGTTHFIGTGQGIPVLNYQDVNVELGDATLLGNLQAQNVRLGVPQEGPGLPGELRLGGHTLTVTGNLQVVGQGSLSMFAPADSLDVSGDIDMSSGGKSENLIAGTIVARGPMYLADSSIVASGTHRVVFADTTPQPLWITSNAGAAPTFNRMTVAPGSVVQFNQFSSGELIVADSLVIAGNFQQASGNQRIIARGPFVAPGQLTLSTLELHGTYDNTGGAYANDTYFAGTGQTIPQNSYVNLHVTGTAALAASLTGPFALGGDLDVENGGTLTLGGKAIDVTGQTQILSDGLLLMNDSRDSLLSTYGVTFDGRSTAGSLTAGTIVTNYVRQLASTSPQSFYATGTQRTVIRLQNPTPGADNIVMATPGQSQFNELIFDNLGGPTNNGTFSTSALVADSLVVQAVGGAQITSTNPGLILVGGPLVMNDPVADLNVDTLELHGTVQVGSSSLGPNLIRFAGFNQQIPDTQNYNGIEVTGTATLETGGGFVTGSNIAVVGNGQLSLGANSTIRSFGNFTTAGNGTIALTTPTSALDVFGNAQFLGGSTEGLLTGGTVTFYGDLTGIGATSDSAFRPGFGFNTIFDGDRTHQVALPTQFQSKSYLENVNITANDIVDVNGQPLEMFGRVDLGPSAGLVNSAGGLPWVEVLGVFTAAAGANIQLPTLGFRDTVLVDPSASYNVGETFYAYYNLPVPVLPYQQLQFQGGTPFLGANVTATQAVYVNGQGTSADLRLNGFTLNTGDFEAGNGGSLTMDQPTDSLLVSAHAYFQGVSEHGKLTAGLISLGGDFTQDTVFGGSPSSFITEGTAVELAPSTPHTIKFVTPDSSFFPAINGAVAAPLSLQIVGRARIAGELNYYGLDLTGDTLAVDSTITGGPAGASATLRTLQAGRIDGGTSWTTFNVGTTQFTAPGSLLSLPYDTLIVSDTLQGGFSQLVNANYLEVTGPGNPHHAGAHAGWLYLQGGDGNTTMSVKGDVLVSGTDATIHSNYGTLTTTGNLDIINKGLIVSNVTGCCGQSLWDIGGNVNFAGAATKDSLTSGLLIVGGDFKQGGSDFESFVADSDFVTQFLAGGTHVVTFNSPTAAGGNGSHFGSLEFGNASGIVMQTATPLWVEGTLVDTTFSGPTLQNTGGGLNTLTVRDANVLGITFDHLQLHLQKNGAPHFGFVTLGNVTFSNFLSSEDQFLVDIPGTSTQFNWGTFTFTPLNTGDTGHYVVATDTDGGTPDVLTISLGTNNFFASDIPFYVALNGAILNPFSP